MILLISMIAIIIKKYRKTNYIMKYNDIKQKEEIKGIRNNNFGATNNNIFKNINIFKEMKQNILDKKNCKKKKIIFPDIIKKCVQNDISINNMKIINKSEEFPRSNANFQKTLNMNYFKNKLTIHDLK